MHATSGAAEAIQKLKPMDPSKLGIDEAIEEWGPATVTKIAKIKAKLSLETPGHKYIHDSLCKLETTYLKEGYQEVLRALVPRESDQVVLAHNDAQENNILSSLSDNSKLYLIDYEYGMWNPKYYDVANYLNEFVCDNAHPCEPGVTYYPSNWPTEGEIVALTREYWLCEQGSDAQWSLANPECSSAVQQVKALMVLNNYYWAVWAVMMLSEADETDPKVFNWAFFLGRCDLHLVCVQQFGIGAI